MFDFNVRHVLGRKNVVADALLRKPNGPVPDEDGDLDDWVDSQLDAVHLHVRPITIQPISNIEAAEGAGATDDGSPLDIGIIRAEFRNFKRLTIRHIVRGRQLFRKQSKDTPLVRIVDNIQSRKEIIARLHNESGHRSREGTYRKVADRYF
ncbi:MAG: hypothetical protein FE78DRAFT_27583 [Acidomyces sp. 'richmondensis']|nr:MAG: hypothetical protein FE78DRAFT_27583 [Acidomyces sp. 'richmondensis']